jgi:hypothetical protein
MELIKKNIYGLLLIFTLAIFGLNNSASAQGVPGLHVYPNKGQSHEQQSKDEQNCYNWAQDESYNNPTPVEPGRKHKTAKRSAAGAGVGAIIGGGKGAAIGAGVGAIQGRRSHNRDKDEAAAAANSDFVRAYSSCMQSKGYSVQ